MDSADFPKKSFVYPINFAKFAVDDCESNRIIIHFTLNLNYGKRNDCQRAGAGGSPLLW